MPQRPSKSRRPGVVGATLAYFRARRALVPFVASVAYVASFGMRVERGAASRPLVLSAFATACAFVAASPSLPGNGLRDDGRRNVGLVAYALWAFAVVLASVAGGPARPDPWQALCGLLAALFAGGLAARGLARIRGGHGVADSLPPAPRGQLIATVGFLVLGAAFAATASARVLGDGASDAWAREAEDAHSLAAGFALAVLAATTWETLRIKRLVLGAGDRALAALWVVVSVSAVAAGVLLLGQGATDRVLRLAVALSGLAVTYIATEGDAEVITRRGRRAIALLLFGGPFVLLGGLASEGPGRSLLPLLATGLVSLAVGSAIKYLEQPIRRADGRLFDSVAAATEALLRADPETSVREALGGLRTFSDLSSHSPELWSLAPPRVLTIDGAGYPHEREAEVPPHLLDVARDEPEATVRAELLDALVVRRPDLRPLARWMDEHGALSATLVMREREIEGVLVLPRGARSVPMSLEEVRAVKRLSDAFSGAAAARAALERSLERERVSRARADEAEAVLLVRDAALARVGARERVRTGRLADPVQGGGPYSPLARLAVDAMERHVERRAPFVVLVPNGADMISYLARVHLGTPRASAPFVVVDAAALANHELTLWADPVASPLALGQRGTVVIEAAPRLPPPVQALIATAFVERHGPWHEKSPGDEPLDVLVVLTMPELAPLEPSFALLMEGALGDAVVWPHLHERGEDLRSLVLAGLAREGLCLRGAPLGIDDAAYELLADHAFDGEDAELRSILKQLALLAKGDVVRAADVRELGLVADPSRRA